jgi:serine protease
VDVRYAWRFPGGDGKDVPVVRIGASGHVAEQILAALPTCGFGDILLLDVEYAYGPHGTRLPAEVYDAEFEAIRLATALGVMVVETAGDGGYDLDWFQTAAEHRILTPGDEHFRDSGAVLVTGAASPVPHERAVASNYGARVDCYAWAELGAAAIVAEVAAVVQSMAAQTRGYRFAPDQLRQVLRTEGTAADPGSDRIGVMPDLRRIVNGDALRLAPDLYLRDFIGDGGEPHAGPISSSPDIIVRRARVPDPQLAFGEGSGTEDGATVAESPQPGQDNYVYVRVRNQGGDEAQGAKATVYWAPAATLLVPALWREIGTVVLPTVPTGDSLTVSREIVWPAREVPEDPHCCFVAMLHAHNDPAPGREALSDWQLFYRMVRDSNNVAARNIQVVDNVASADADPAGYVPLSCVVTGAFDRMREMTLEVYARLPQGTRLLFEAPLALIRELGLRREQVELQKGVAIGRLPVTAHGRQPVGIARLPAGSARECRLLVRLPEAPSDRFLRVALRQSYQGVEVGRVTWLLAPPGWCPPRPGEDA